MESGKLLMIGGIGVGAYFAYKWYAGSGGYADQQICTSLRGQPQSAQDSQTMAVGIYNDAKMQNISTDQLIASITDPKEAACARVACAAYPASTVQQGTAANPLQAAQTLQPTSPVVPVAVPAATPSGMDALYAKIVAAAAGDSNLVNGQMSGDHWNYWANQITGLTLPGNWPSGPLTAAQYWAAAAPGISAATGLSGLGIFGGLGQLVARRDWN